MEPLLGYASAVGILQCGPTSLTPTAGASSMVAIIVSDVHHPNTSRAKSRATSTNIDLLMSGFDGVRPRGSGRSDESIRPIPIHPRTKVGRPSVCSVCQGWITFIEHVRVGIRDFKGKPTRWIRRSWRDPIALFPYWIDEGVDGVRSH